MFSLSQMVEIAHSDRRTVQFWVESGALLPSAATNRAGRGVHREFDRDELIIACTLSAVAQAKLPIGRLIVVSKALRTNFLVVPDGREYIEKAINGPGHVFLKIRPGREDETELVCEPDAHDERAIYGDLIRTNRRHDSSALVFYLNPWLEGVPMLPK
jgi:hypothetical protein